MTTKHPMGSVPMPEPDGYAALTANGSIIVPPSQYQKYNAYAVFTADQLRSYGLSAYEMGRNAGLEEAAKHFCAKGHGCEMFVGAIEDEIRSLKR